MRAARGGMRGIQARALTVALLIVALAAFAPSAQAEPARGAQAIVHAAPIAIDINGLFGDENEPDENEPDEGAPASAQDANQGSGGVSLPVVAVLVALAAGLGAFLVLRIRRLYLRLQDWSRAMWARR